MPFSGCAYVLYTTIQLLDIYMGLYMTQICICLTSHNCLALCMPSLGKFMVGEVDGRTFVIGTSVFLATPPFSWLASVILFMEFCGILECSGVHNVLHCL